MSIRHHVRHTAFVAAAVMAISAVLFASAYAGVPGAFQPGDDQLGGGWQVIGQKAPAATPVATLASVPPIVGAAVPDNEGEGTAPPAKPIQPQHHKDVPAYQPAPQVASTPAPVAPEPISLATAARAAPVAPVAPIAAPEGAPALSVASFSLVAGESIETQLRDWASRAGWSVDWQLQDDWVVPGNSSYGADFAQAATQVIEQLAQNGADIRADIYPGNHALVVHEAGAN